MKTAVGGLIASLLCLTMACSKPDRTIQKALDKGQGTVQLPPGVTELNQELRITANAGPLEVVGSADTVLRAGSEFQGRALIVVEGARNVRLRDFTLDGNRIDLQRPTEMPARGTSYSSQFQRNGIVIEGSEDVTIRNIKMKELVNFGVLASSAKKLTIDNVSIEDSGARDSRGRNNTSGGILLEEGTQDFEIRKCSLRRVTGNGIWTYASSFSKRNARGMIAENKIETVGRHGIEIGHGNRIRVENNSVQFAGYPVTAVDVEAADPPAAFATSARVDESAFVGNTATEVNGRCFHLDGFHDGEITRNTCRNRGTDLKEYPQGEYALGLGNTYPEMQSQFVTIHENTFEGFRYGAIYLIGQHHKISENSFRNLNLAECGAEPKAMCNVRPEEPDYHKAGIYLAFRAARPAPPRENVIEKNEIAGYGMKDNCVLRAPTVRPEENTIAANKCRDGK